MKVRILGKVCVCLCVCVCMRQKKILKQQYQSCFEDALLLFYYVHLDALQIQIKFSFHFHFEGFCFLVFGFFFVVGFFFPPPFQLNSSSNFPGSASSPERPLIIMKYRFHAGKLIEPRSWIHMLWLMFSVWNHSCTLVSGRGTGIAL